MENENKTSLATLLGGQEITVKMRDGTEEKVMIRDLTIRDLEKHWLNALQSEAVEVELYCGKEAGWDDKITIESHEKIMEIGEPKNRPTAARWGERRRAKLEHMQGMLSPEARKSLSPTSSSPAVESSANPQPK